MFDHPVSMVQTGRRADTISCVVLSDVNNLNIVCPTI